MTINVSPLGGDKNTHHVALEDKLGNVIGLIMVDPNGKVTPKFTLSPVQRTALKTTTGNSSYDSMEWPYAPVVQDTWEGGRGQLDFERDTTKFYDAYRARTSRSNKMFLGPQEQYTKGYRGQDYSVPGNVRFHTLTGERRMLAKRFQAMTGGYTVGLHRLLVRKTKLDPGNLKIGIYADAASQIVTPALSEITVTPDRLDDVLSEWLAETTSQVLVGGTWYWIKVESVNTADNDEKHWDVAVSDAHGSTYYSETGVNWAAWHDATDFDLYFRTTDADTEKRTIYYQYKGQQYKVVSGLTGAPKLYMNGDRGAADSNGANLSKLFDATKTWVADSMIGWVVVITGGPGSQEETPYRKITTNGGSDLTVDSPFLITHTTATEYVLIAADTWKELTGHGMTAPVTDVVISTQGVVYFCQGDAVKIRRHREWNNAGTWQDSTATEWADEGNAASYASFMVYKPQAGKLVIAKNMNTSSVNVVTTEVSSNASIPVWGTDLTWAAAVQVGDLHERITGLEVYPDDSGNEAVRVYKAGVPWWLPTSGTPYPVNLREMGTLKSVKNGKAHLIHNVYEYFSLGNGVTRYYGGNFTEVGPNQGEGLPLDRQGPVAFMVGYPGKVFMLVDGGATGYSSLLMLDGSGYHEHYRAPKGQRLLAAGYQTIPGTTSDRLWLQQGNDSIWLPFPSDTTNELDDANYQYTHEAAVVLSRMHAGLFEVLKLVRFIRLQSDNLATDSCWVELDYRLNENEAWETIVTKFTTSPSQEIDLIEQLGIAGKRLQFRLRLYTTNRFVTPLVLAFIVDAVLRSSIKNQYPITFRLMDNEPALNGERNSDPSDRDPIKKLRALQEWADDRSTGMLKMRAASKLWDGLVVYLNAIEVDQIFIKPDPEKDEGYDVYVCTTSFQEA